MPRISYQDKSFGPDAEAIIRQANTICADYAAQGFDLTLRQLYYQFVARDLIPNNQKSYKKLGDIVKHARLAGRLDWDYIVDRTRNLRETQHYGSPQEILDVAANAYRIDKWNTQPVQIEVWIEKDALVGVIEGVCRANDVPYYASRGYNSSSEHWGAGQRICERALKRQQKTLILHLGDHDPSGVDMTRDIQERLDLFYRKDILRALLQQYRDNGKVILNDEGKLTWVGNAQNEFDEEFDTYRPLKPEVERIGLNWDQIQQYNPPPNFAKITDTRARRYIEEFGEESWELDALDPNVIIGLIQDGIDFTRDEELWDAQVELEDQERAQLRELASSYRGVNGDA